MSQTLRGVTQFFLETGSDGYWAFQDERFMEEGYSSYKGLHPLRDGDALTVYDVQDPERVLWHGVIALEATDDDQEFLAVQRGQELSQWSKLFLTEHPALLITRDRGASHE